jgi:hypothetical protein
MRKLTFAALLATIPVYGQVSTGTLNVDVQDSSGALIPGAIVTVLHVSTGQTRSGPTNETGSFRASFVPVGDYSVAAEARGAWTRTRRSPRLSSPAT